MLTSKILSKTLSIFTVKVCKENCVKYRRFSICVFFRSLCKLVTFMEIVGFEPTTFYVQSKHSTNWVIFPKHSVCFIIDLLNLVPATDSSTATLLQLARNYRIQCHSKIYRCFKVLFLASIETNFLEVMGETCNWEVFFHGSILVFHYFLFWLHTSKLQEIIRTGKHVID